MDPLYRVETDGGPCHAVRRYGIWHMLEGDLFGARTVGAALPDQSPRLLAPVVPSKIVAVGLNYKDHAAEMNKPLPDEPLIFLKPSTAVIAWSCRPALPAYVRNRPRSNLSHCWGGGGRGVQRTWKTPSRCLCRRRKALPRRPPSLLRGVRGDA